MATKTAAAKSKIVTLPGYMTVDSFLTLVASGLDEVYQREYQTPVQGMRYFRDKPMKKRELSFQNVIGAGIVAQNNDDEDLPKSTKQEGFGWTLTSEIYRGGIEITQELEEDELYGQIKDLQMQLSESDKYAKELILADVFNRAFGAAGAPVLCEDGMYFIDEERPNARADAGEWSNLLAAGAITPSAIWDAMLAYRTMKGERGEPAPMTMTKCIVNPAQEKTISACLNSTKSIEGTWAVNDENFLLGKLSYEVYDMLTIDAMFTLAGDAKSSKNELYFGNRKAAELDTIRERPNMTTQWIRSRFGVGIGRPHAWMGQDCS